MFPTWRLTRNRYTRSLYDLLEARGVTASRMIEYVAELADRPVGTSEHRDIGDADTKGVYYTTGPLDDERFAGLVRGFPIEASPLDGEWAVVATVDSGAVGRALVSADTRPYVTPLGQRLSFEGAYVRRVYVHPEWRNKGIAKHLITDALEVAAGEFGVDTASALIAADNRPSRWVFEATGFRPVRRHDYAHLFGLEYSRRSTLERGDRT